MKINDYQNATVKTAIYPPEIAVMYLALGLAGEAGEVANKVKKVVRDHGGNFNEIDKSVIAGELGDVCWYVVRMAAELGFDMETILAANQDKLESRKERNVLSGDGDNR